MPRTEIVTSSFSRSLASRETLEGKNCVVLQVSFPVTCSSLTGRVCNMCNLIDLDACISVFIIYVNTFASILFAFFPSFLNFSISFHGRSNIRVHLPPLNETLLSLENSSSRNRSFWTAFSSSTKATGCTAININSSIPFS